ncbi:hypothetical protein D9M71_524180 [compost metagenome]
MVFAALEHQVFEQVRKAGAAGRFVLAAHVVPDVHRHDRRLAVGVHHHAQAVGQGELFKRNVDLGDLGRPCHHRGRGEAAQGGGKRYSQQRGTRSKLGGHSVSLVMKVKGDASPGLRVKASANSHSLCQGTFRARR